MKYFIYIALFLFSFQTYGQTNPQKFNRAKWEELKGKIKYKKSPPKSNSSKSWEGDSSIDPSDGNTNSKKYREDRGNYREGDSGTSRAKEKPDSDDSSFNTGGWGGVAKVLMVIVAIILIAFILYQLLFKNKSNAQVNTAIHEDQEEFDIHTIQKSELELALEKALKEEDYRKCIRIYFVFILKELSNKDLILWERDKTNYQYLNELKDAKEFHQFRTSVEIFEIIWYGERQLNLAIYEQIVPELKNFLNQLSTE